MSDDTPTRRAVLRRMAELGIRTLGDLADRAGVDPDTITALLDERRAPRKATRGRVGEALGWPADWLDYARRGEDPPSVDPRPDRAGTDGFTRGRAASDVRSSELAASVLITSVAKDLKLEATSEPGRRTGDVLVNDAVGRLVAGVVISVYRDGDDWADEMTGRASAVNTRLHGTGAKAVVYVADADEDAVKALFERDPAVWKQIDLVIDDEQLESAIRRAREKVAG